MGKLRILLADDHAVVREGLRSLIDAQPDLEVVGEASDGESACRKAKELLPDVVVMDVSMPGLTGDQATEQLKRDHPGRQGPGPDRLRGQESPAQAAQGRGVRLRPQAGDGRGAHPRPPRGRRGRRLPRPGAGGEGRRRHRATRAPRRAGPTGTHLTERESQVVLRVAQGFSNKEIAAQLDISVKTVETHKLRSMEKLGLRSRAEVVQFALRQGWLAQE